MPLFWVATYLMFLDHFNSSSPAVRNAKHRGEREQSVGNSNAPFLYNGDHKTNRNIKFLSRKKATTRKRIYLRITSSQKFHKLNKSFAKLKSILRDKSRFAAILKVEEIIRKCRQVGFCPVHIEDVSGHSTDTNKGN